MNVEMKENTTNKNEKKTQWNGLGDTRKLYGKKRKEQQINCACKHSQQHRKIINETKRNETKNVYNREAKKKTLNSNGCW